MAAAELLRQAHASVEWVVATDRSCGIEAACREHEVPLRRIEEADNDRFSRSAKEWLVDEHGVDAVVLFFSRLVTRPLFGTVGTYNLHPSLLPAFKGFRALENTLKQGTLYSGATLHRVTENADSGPIVAQTCVRLTANTSLEALERSAYLQKVYLTLWLADSLSKESAFDRVVPEREARFANPRLKSHALWSQYEMFLDRHTPESNP
jgi:phosphoribosylglycinamide formyltransferase 1